MLFYANDITSRLSIHIYGAIENPFPLHLVGWKAALIGDMNFTIGLYEVHMQNKICALPTSISRKTNEKQKSIKKPLKIEFDKSTASRG